MLFKFMVLFVLCIVVLPSYSQELLPTQVADRRMILFNERKIVKEGQYYRQDTDYFKVTGSMGNVSQLKKRVKACQEAVDTLNSIWTFRKKRCVGYIGGPLLLIGVSQYNPYQKSITFFGISAIAYTIYNFVRYDSKIMKTIDAAFELYNHYLKIELQLENS